MEKSAPTHILSPHLESFLEELVAGRSPNIGRFCGQCYTPLPTGHERCGHCGHGVAETAPLERLPQGVVAVFRAQRQREGMAVRLTFYSTLFLGIFASALGMAFLPFWWNVVAFMGGLGGSYILSANVANTLGDALGYRWGRQAAQRQWQRRSRG